MTIKTIATIGALAAAVGAAGAANAAPLGHAGGFHAGRGSYASYRGGSYARPYYGGRYGIRYGGARFYGPAFATTAVLAGYGAGYGYDDDYGYAAPVVGYGYGYGAPVVGYGYGYGYRPAVRFGVGGWGGGRRFYGDRHVAVRGGFHHR
jgi:hypothetical protein